MLYTAKHHIGLRGAHVYPGEVVENLDAETAEWLLRNGAIEPIPGTASAKEEPAEEIPAEDSEEPAEEIPAEDSEEAAEAEPTPTMTIDAAEGIKPAKKNGRKKK